MFTKIVMIQLSLRFYWLVKIRQPESINTSSCCHALFVRIPVGVVEGSNKHRTFLQDTSVCVIFKSIVTVCLFVNLTYITLPSKT